MKKLVPLTADGVEIGFITLNEDGTLQGQVQLIDNIPWDTSGVGSVEIKGVVIKGGVLTRG